MRKRVLFAILAGLGAMIMIVFADSNWLLAALVGVGLGAVVFTFVHAYPHDIAPPSDRRHENSLRRRAAQRESLR